MTKSKFPPHMWIAKEAEEMAFNFPGIGFHSTTIQYKQKTQEYLSLEEHEALLKEARAEVWEEAADAVTGSLDEFHHGDEDAVIITADWMREKAKQEREK